MHQQYIITGLLIAITAAAIAYALYVKIKEKSYTRERYAFASLAAIVSILTLGIHSLTSRPPWSLFGTLFGPQSEPPGAHWSEHTLIALLVIVGIITINRSLHNWDGLISVKQKERERIREDRNWLFDGMQEAVRIVRRQEPLQLYHPFDYSRSFPSLEAPHGALAWHENARDLISLRWRSHTFDMYKGWHPQASVWIGHNNKTNALAALLCVREWPNQEELNRFTQYVTTLEIANGRRIEFIVAVQNGAGSAEKYSGTYQISIATQNALLDELVDFSDYFLEIERRVTIDCLPDSNLTIEDVYVRPLFTKAGSNEPPIDLEDYLVIWSSENSSRQLAILGEYGQGKSTVALKFTNELIKKARKGSGRIPLLIELRGKSPSTLQPLELLGAWAATYRIEAQSILKLITAGRVLLIFEGFDEMAEVGDVESRFNHFRSLWKFCYPNNKLLITGRPNFFLDDRELHAALGLHASTGSAPYCEALSLNFFSDSQIELALRNMERESRKQILDLSKADQKFRDIVSRPSLLYIVSLLWESALAQQAVIDSAYVIDLFIQHSYQRQAAKTADDRQFMVLSLREREYFLDGIAAHMVAKATSNQIVPEQFRNAIAKLFSVAPESLFRKQSASERGPSRPLSERMKDRLNPIEDIETDVRTYGILVRDYSRPGALRFPHKSFFELIFAKYMARQLIGEDKEETAAIASATEVEIGSLIYMPESLAFLGEILGRMGRTPSSDEGTLRASDEGRIRDLFNLVVFGSKYPIPTFLGKLVLFEYVSREYRIVRALSTLVFILPMMALSVLIFTTFNISTDEKLQLPLNLFMSGKGPGLLPVLVAMVPLFLMTLVMVMNYRNRIRLWYPVIRSLGFRSKDLKRLYGSFISRGLELIFEKYNS